MTRKVLGEDIALVQENGCYDLKLVGNDFVKDGGMETSIIIALFTNRGLALDQLRTLGLEYNDGWWGDALLPQANDKTGSRLWSLNRYKVTNETLRLTEDYVKESLNFLIEDNVASQLVVNATVDGQSKVNVQIEVIRPDLEILKFGFVWNNQLKTLVNKRG